ncbi:MAG: acriflavine resistance protein B [Chromatiales bacterium 21-64-14]|nr:MAG: acriflavine resistance protein B [Chromatiales bacterium 21-64-14]HQU15938.1 efflux RND transporter permease subunit [Gammaproteobacteria bacterium]
MALPDSVRGILQRPVLWVLVYGALLVYGVYAFLHIPVEVLPNFHYPVISVITHYPGATAEELENTIARPLESELLALPNLVMLRTVMGEGTVQTDVRFRNGTSAEQDLQAVYSAVDRARSRLPTGARPYAEIMGAAIDEVADYAVQIPAGVAPMRVQRAIKTRIVPALRALPGVRLVEVFGSGDEALWVQPDPLAMRHYGVGFAALTHALNQQVLLGPAGYLSIGHQTVLLEARHLPERASELRMVPVPGPAGPIPLGALARVVSAPVPIRYAVDLDGRPTIAMIVFKQPGASTVPVTHAVAQTLQRLQTQLPGGASWTRVYSQGHLVGLIYHDLVRNLLIGGLLAVGVLFFLLGTHRGVWVLALSIPMALLMGIAGLYAAGQSLNLLTLGALTVGVGLLADDGIIVLESIYHRWEQGDGGLAGVARGLRDIAGPDVTGTLTTVSVFLPLLFVGGLAGIFFVPFALAMGLSLLASLLISLTLIPLLLSLVGSQPHQRAAGAAWVEWLADRNQRLLNWTLRHPRGSLAGAVALFLASLVALTVVPIHFLPLPNEGVLLESFTLPPGSSLAQTQAAVNQMTRQLRADPDVEHVFARIGSAGSTSYTEHNFAGEIQVVLKPKVAVQSLDALAARLLRESRVPAVQRSVDTPTIERVGESLSGLPQPFVIRLFGSHIPELRRLSKEVVQRLRGVPALADLFNNDAYPVTQLQIRPRTAALALYGVTPAALYAQLRPALGGEVVARIPQGNYHLDLYERLADAPHLGLQGLAALLIHTDKGWTPLGQLAQLTLVAGPNQIRHVNGARALDILGTPTGSLGSAVTEARAALKSLHLPAGYRVAFGGLFPRLEKAAAGLGIAALGAFALMVGILILQFDGLRLPGILLLQMPLAFTGAALTLAVSGRGLNAIGLVGILTLVGISLNHGIVLLHRARRNEMDGMDVEAAIREAVRVRFRPILLTTLTAILGMLPTALGWGLGAAPEQGLALVILGGVVWSSLLSTNLIPALYLHWHRPPAHA